MEKDELTASTSQIRPICSAPPPILPSRTLPPPYTQFYSEPILEETTDNEAARPWYSKDTNNNMGIAPEVLRPDSDAPVQPIQFLSPMYSGHLYTIPLTIENPIADCSQGAPLSNSKRKSSRRRSRISSSSSGSDTSISEPGLSVFKKIGYVELTKMTSHSEELEFCLRDSKGHSLFSISDNVGCGASLLGRHRPFDLTVLDQQFTQQIFTVQRPFTCNSGLMPLCTPSLRVAGPDGLLGSVKLKWSMFGQHLTVHAKGGSSPLLHIKRHRLPLITRDANEFKIFRGKVQVGKIHSRFSTSTCTGKDCEERLGVSFPIDLPVNQKATLVGALFLLRELYFKP